MGAFGVHGRVNGGIEYGVDVGVGVDVDNVMTTLDFVAEASKHSHALLISLDSKPLT